MPVCASRRCRTSGACTAPASGSAAVRQRRIVGSRLDQAPVRRRRGVRRCVEIVAERRAERRLDSRTRPGRGRSAVPRPPFVSTAGWRRALRPPPRSGRDVRSASPSGIARRLGMFAAPSANVARRRSPRSRPRASFASAASAAPPRSASRFRVSLSASSAASSSATLAEFVALAAEPLFRFARRPLDAGSAVRRSRPAAR